MMDITSILLMLVFGALIGWLAGFFVRKDGGLVTNIIIGIIGSFLGGRLFQQFGQAGVTGFNLYSVLVSLVGAIILVALVNFFTK